MPSYQNNRLTSQYLAKCPPLLGNKRILKGTKYQRTFSVGFEHICKNSVLEPMKNHYLERGEIFEIFIEKEN